MNSKSAYMIRHVFLPPQLPQEDDSDPLFEDALLNTVFDALQAFGRLINEDIIDLIGSMIGNLRTVRDELGAIDEDKLKNVLQDLPKGGFITFDIKAQNAGVLISCLSDKIHFEVFELSPDNKSVISTKGRLRRSFPGYAVAVSTDTYFDNGFQATVAQAIAKMSIESVDEMIPKVTKAKQRLSEIRDTTQPHLVTEHLTNFLRATGEPIDVSTLWKNTRDEVLWTGSLLPWRRSPMWLLVRVSMQLAFSRRSTNSPQSLYKSFMVFFMSRILELSLELPVEMDLIYSMNAKLSQRLLKLGDVGPHPWLATVHAIMSKADEKIMSTWQSVIVQTLPKSHLSYLEGIRPAQDALHTLADLDGFVHSLHKLPTRKSASIFHATGIFPNFAPDVLPTFPLVLGSLDASFGLVACESWVEQHLDAWLEQHVSESTTCKLLKDIIESYHKSASHHSTGNPEACSIMFLTIMELWIACDKSGSCIHPMLLDYDPEITGNLLWSLLLPLKSQMRRLMKIESYLNSRKARAKRGLPSPFRHFGHLSSFAVRHFNQSPLHQQLLADIEQSAARDKRAKISELSRLNEEYRNLMRLHEQADCEYYQVLIDEDEDIYEWRHSSNCTKCGYNRRAKSLQIQVHEWPLSRDQNEAKATVFELLVPVAYGAWRDSTHFLLKAILHHDYSSPGPTTADYALRNDPGLQHHYVPVAEHVGIRSKTKPQVVTHLKGEALPATEGRVCRNNGLSYLYFDFQNKSPTSSFITTETVHNLCTFTLPARSQKLHVFLSRAPSTPDGPPPNVVIASQADCPDHMTLDEYKAFGTLPLGHVIQWTNILTQLAIPALDFAKPETTILLLQIIQQAGPNGSIERPSHEILTVERFASALQERLWEAKMRVGDNWESSSAIGTFIRLAARLLSLSNSEKIQEECLKYLESCRSLVFSWLARMRSKVQSSIDDAQRTQFAAYTVELGLICLESFNVSQEYLTRTLAGAESSIFIQCSISVQEHLPPEKKKYDVLTSIMLARWRMLMYRAHAELVYQIVECDSSSLNHAIHEYWIDYKAGHSWRQLPKPYEHWLESSTASDGQSLSVNFNLLSAELLVNGSPVSGLPARYENDPLYPTFFGQAPLQVMPSSIPGLEYSARSKHFGYAIHFGTVSTSSGEDFLLHADKNGHKFSLVSPKVFSGKLPNAFIRHFVHWYDHESGEILFTPIKTPWSMGPGNWRLVKQSAGWRVERQDTVLVSVVSDTAHHLTEVVGLDECFHTHILFCEKTKQLEIKLPRLQLGFYSTVGTNDVWSREYRGMSIDRDQNIGTLVGLTSKLVLKSNADHTARRLVIIPDGNVVFERSVNHVTVAIKRGSGSKVHAYPVDNLLGRLVDNGNMQSKLFVGYLHALTSYCLPDPLTQRTGTEQALFILRSAAVRSFQVLRQDNLVLLERVARLAPSRSYYPSHLQVMQTVDWDARLSFLAQDGQLYTTVRDIFLQMNGTKFLYPDTYIEPPRLDFTMSHLLQRDLIRASTFRVSGFGAEMFTLEHDEIYHPRDRGQHSDRAKRTYAAARSFLEKAPVIQDEALSQLNGYLWKTLAKQTFVLGPKAGLSLDSLLYRGDLLGKTASHLGPLWCPIHTELSNSLRYNKYQFMMWLSTLSFAKEADMRLIYTVMAFYCVPNMSLVSPPAEISFKPDHGDGIFDLQSLIRPKFREFLHCPESRLPQHNQETKANAQKRRLRKYSQETNRQLDLFVQVLKQQWPCEVPQVPSGDGFNVYINTKAAIANLKQPWRIWFQNHLFHQYLNQIEEELHREAVSTIEMDRFELRAGEPEGSLRRRHVMANDIFALPPPKSFEATPGNLKSLVRSEYEPEASNVPIENLLQSLDSKVTAPQQIHYVEELRDSLAHLSSHSTKYGLICSNNDVHSALSEHRIECKEYVRTLLSAMTECSQVFGITNSVHQGPRLSTVFYLEQLSHKSWPTLPEEWKQCIVGYAMALTALQRSERLLRVQGSHVDLTAELSNAGHQNWDPMQHPEWLLLEVESGVMIREVQVDIAKQMLSPETNVNSVMQLNMGEGKTTIIVPSVCAVLAEGTKLVRVIVARPQSKQMLNVLIAKLGGLINRRIYHLPFSRSLQLSLADAEALREICADCMRNRGILLVQPEHILSFKLMGLECSIKNEKELAKSLLKSQHLFDTKSRDVIDESDENFSVKFELIYTMGMPQPIEFSPHRWIIIQHVLGLVFRFAHDIHSALGSQVVEMDGRPGRLPRTRLLRPQGHELLRDKIATHICEYGISGFPIAHLSSNLRALIYRYITQAEPTADDINQLELAMNGGMLSESMNDALLLFRGLIACGVISFTFGAKRWRVNYGLNHTRSPPTKVAVPFRAKDSPEQRSDFSHTDVVLVLTSLSHYYGGLEDDDLFLTFGHLFENDQANIEYGLWVDTAPALPEAFRKLSGINIKDRFQCVDEVFPALRYSKGAIDYFLANLVFSKVMKDFPHKITASGWDLGLTKANLTTGFSGTMDSKWVLPLDVQHLDLPQQRHTNALVLKHILRDENSVVPLPPKGARSDVSDAYILLETVVRLDPGVRVIIDVGAQILELDNKQVAKEWLHMWKDDDKTKAAIFFNENDELSIIDRNDHVELLQTSSFAHQTEMCLVFLDEAHTRGTDLKLPTSYRAVVTLGANLTKDRLVQACMRMRKLGKGQSLVFCVPEEIQRKIIEFTKKAETAVLEVTDVLAWAISETFWDLQRSLPLWAAQGRRFIEHSKIWREVKTEADIESFLAKAPLLLEEEAQTLKNRYRPRGGAAGSGWDLSNEKMKRILDRCRDFDCLGFESAALQEEQERELSPEKLQERQVERPARSLAHPHSLHPDLIEFVTTGDIKAWSSAFIPAFRSLNQSTAAECFDVSQFPPDLLVTADFERTVKFTGKYVSDGFHRPVQWVLTSTLSRTSTRSMVVISPFEAQKLMQKIKAHQKVTLHTYSPRSNLEYRPLDSLDLFTEGATFDSVIPRHLIIQLNLFAGQLYLGSFNEYKEVCEFLGLAWNVQEDGTEIQSDGFIVSGGQSTFTQSPVKFLRLLMAKIRRNGRAIDKTHIGRILEGALLEKSDLGE